MAVEGEIATQNDSELSKEPFSDVDDTPPATTLPESAPPGLATGVSSKPEEGALNGGDSMGGDDGFEAELDETAKEVAHRAVSEAEKEDLVAGNTHMTTQEEDISEAVKEDPPCVNRVAQTTTIHKMDPKSEKKDTLQEDTGPQLSSEEKNSLSGLEEGLAGQESTVSASRED